MVELVSEPAAVELPHVSDDVGGGAACASKRLRRNIAKIGCRDAVEFGRELGRARWRRAQRIDLDLEVAIPLNRAHQARGCRGLSQELGVRGGGGRRRAPPREAFGQSEVLPPTL